MQTAKSCVRSGLQDYRSGQGNKLCNQRGDAMGRLSSALGGGMRYDYRYYEGGAGQMNTIYSWGTLKEAGIIFDMDTVVIK